MTVLNELVFQTPVLRVNDKDANIRFYEECLGLRLVSEENALAFFSAWENADATFMIEESPAYRTRATQGPKKLKRLVIKASQASDVEKLLATQASVLKVFKGEVGYAFEVLSPEQDVILLHAEENLASLAEIDRPTLTVDPDFKGLADFKVTSLTLNVPDVEQAKTFYDQLFQAQKPLDLVFEEAVGPDLQVEPNETWDVEILSFTVAQETDLAALRDTLVSAGHEVYMDSKARLLVVSDTSRIEIWIEKA